MKDDRDPPGAGRGHQTMTGDENFARQMKGHKAPGQSGAGDRSGENPANGGARGSTNANTRSAPVVGRGNSRY
jgi:hypothetical protein